MTKLGMIVMAVIAAGIVLASCGTQPHSLFADRTATPQHTEQATETAS